MATIKDKNKYDAVMSRIEELMAQVNEDSPLTDKRVMELDLLVELAEEYEDEHYPIGTPSLPDVIKLRMYEMNLTQEKLAELLGLSQSSVSKFLTGKATPSLDVAREISTRLNIAPAIILGV